MAARLQRLLVDDEPIFRDLLEQQLADLDCELRIARDGGEALEMLGYDFPGIVVSDINMPRVDGLELLARGRALDPDLPVILISAHGDIAMAVQAMRDGAYDFLERPYHVDRLREKVVRALANRALVLDNRALRAELRAKTELEARILGNSPEMIDLRRDVANIAAADVNVLLRGETGTGKEVVARTLHELSGRSSNRFVPINCGAMPESLIESELFGHERGAFTGATQRRIGKFEYANQGTLFLDEIESMPLGLQTRLLRVLQDREIERLGSNERISVDIRLVAATQVDLAEASDAGRFRLDLFYRLNVAEIDIPPLRDRLDDIPLLFEAFAKELATRHEREVPMLGCEELRQLMLHP